MSIFYQWLKDGDSKKALWSIIEKKGIRSLDEKLEYLVSAINLYEKRKLDEETKDVLTELLPYIKEDEEIIRVLQDSQDIGRTVLTLSQRFKTTQSFHVLAALCILSIAVSLPNDQRHVLISQARKLGAMAKQKVEK